MEMAMKQKLVDAKLMEENDSLFVYKGGMNDENHIQAKQKDVLLIDPSVEEIPDWAFHGCINLKHVVFDYEGESLLKRIYNQDNFYSNRP